MINPASIAKAMIDRLGLKTFLFMTWLLLMILFALGIYLLDAGGPVAFTLKEWIWKAVKSPLPFTPVLSWISWIITAAAAFAGTFIMVVRFSRAEADPLFSPTITLLSFVVLFRLAWSVPGLRKTIVLMLLDPTGICQLIALIMFTGLGICCFQFFSLRKEFRRFEQVKFRMEGVHLVDQPQLDNITEILDQSHGLLKRKWHNLKATIAYAHHPDFDTLADFPDQAELLKEGKTSFIIKILPVLGIIGTVAGFTLAVVGMLDAASTMNDFYSFKGNLINSLGGMKSAFLTTLAGMVAMILVMWINSVIEESRRRILLIEAEFLYVRIFLPWLWLLRGK